MAWNNRPQQHHHGWDAQRDEMHAMQREYQLRAEANNRLMRGDLGGYLTVSIQAGEAEHRANRAYWRGAMNSGGGLSSLLGLNHSGRHYPGGGHHYPGGGSHYPGGGSHYPGGGSHYPGGGHHYTGGGGHYPGGGIHYPGGGIHYPGGTSHYPGSASHYPGVGFPPPTPPHSMVGSYQSGGQPIPPPPPQQQPYSPKQ